jgi:plasmid maintenance system antidote protein VapI
MQKPRNDHRLLDTLITELRARNDAHLAVKLGWPQAYVSKIRNGKMAVTAERILKIHDATGWEIKRIKGLI